MNFDNLPLLADDHEFPQSKAKQPTPPKPYDLVEHARRMVGGTLATRRWKNPLVVPVKFEVHIDAANPQERADSSLVKRLVTIAPGAEVELPKLFDRAIMRVHENMIVGGLAPMLRPLDVPAMPIDPATLAGFEHLLEENAE